MTDPNAISNESADRELERWFCGKISIRGFMGSPFRYPKMANEALLEMNEKRWRVQIFLEPDGSAGIKVRENVKASVIHRTGASLPDAFREIVKAMKWEEESAEAAR